MQGVPMLPMPPHVVDAVARSAGKVFPRQTRGCYALKSAIADQLRRRHGLSVNQDSDLLVTHGAQHGMSIALRGILSPGDEVLVPAPTYFFDAIVKMAGAHPIYVQTNPSDGWALPIDALSSAVTPATRAIIICNPNNPTGNVPTREELTALLKFAKVHNLYVFSDESYEDYFHDGPGYTPQMSLADIHNRLITVTSLSKNYAFSSWRVGYIHAPSDILEAIHPAFECDAINVGDIPQIAAEAALTGPRDWLDVEFVSFRSRRDLLLAEIRGAGFQVVTPRAGIFCYADLTPTGLQGHALEEALLDVGVPCSSGDRFYGNGGYARILYGGTAENIMRVGERLSLLQKL
ncbi:pyridoxal phosphate-dependent aminotransferase [Arthrobacter sp. efr-133-TYG-104]|uniref:pyridoxal phosphate-dependent aminotransferase n=1 Tax=Arthrobacter sp. efr-133-TYG-104 TaxID=3040324 RepID=UPI00254A8492|nr:pyridoxal phosphate-dependent aminotransferase [Arthrobacter sp. efr-133-TYG-104]